MNARTASVTEVIAAIQHGLKHLSFNHADLPIDAVRKTRAGMMDLGRGLLNDRIDELTTEQVWAVHDLIIELDRVGY
jgi:hypothetical protein